MAQLNGLRLYKITFNESLDDKEGLDYVSTVDYPAIEENFIALAKQLLKFNSEPEKQMLYGPILIPDKPIYRFDAQTGEEYYVQFPKDVIEKLVRKFQRQQKTINLNYQHQKDSQIKDAVIQEIWLTGKVDKSQSLGFDLPEGSAFIAAHIGDSKFWNDEIKSGNVKGFSIEGFLDMEMKKLNKKIIMESKFITAKSEQGVEIKSDSETWTSGADVYTEVDGVKKPLATGDYKLENGSVLKVTDGKITEVVEPVTEDQEATEVIQSAVKPLLESIKAEMKSQKEAYEAKIKELETKLSNLPAAQSKPTGDEKKKPLTKKQALEFKLGILRKKDAEVKTKK